MAIEFTESAGKHGYTVADAVCAFEHQRFYVPEFDQSRTGGLRPHLVIGPAVSGVEIEVMFVVEPPETVVIFHVMQVRPKIMRIALRER